MAAPVWVLSVDLQAKTATFQSGMADAAKSARGSFNDIKKGAGEMGGHVSTNMFASRHAVMAVSEAFGDTMPRAITALLVHIGPLGAALEAAFPFAAIGLAAVLLVEHLTKLKEAGVKLTLDQERFGTSVQNAFNSLDQKLLQAGIRADELRNNHIGALRKELELIDHQSMAELVQSFGLVAKAADAIFADLPSHWYTFGVGAAGAKNALDEFTAKYENLLSLGKTGEASDLLKGTLRSADKVLDAFQIAKDTPEHTQFGQDDADAYRKHMEAMQVLHAAGVTGTKDEVKAQETLVEALRAQEGIEARVAALKKAQGGNAVTAVGNESASKAAEAARQAAEHQTKMGELGIAAEREQANVSMTLRNATIAERLASDTKLADEEYRVQLAGNAALQSALDKGGKDYNNQLKALQEKAQELTATHTNTVGILQGKATMEQYRQDLADMEAGEREKINATEQGSRARLAVIDAAIKAEDGLNLQNTAHYRELLTTRAEVLRQAATEEAKLAAEGGKIAADDEEKMGALRLAAAKETLALANSSHRVSIQARLQQEIEAATAEAALKMTAASQEIAALDKHGKDYENKLRELQNKQKQLIQAHEDEVTAIKDRALTAQNQKQLSALGQLESMTADGLTQVIMGHQSFANMMDGIGNQVVSGMLRTALMSIMTADMDAERQAASAARSGFLAGMKFPFPANLVMAPLLGAANFAAMMAFEDGGVVPGIGRGDVVPAMLTPGEGVVPGGVMDGLSKMARSGSMGGNHYHLHAPVHLEASALDGDGIDQVLHKHAGKIQKHFEGVVRRMNR